MAVIRKHMDRSEFEVEDMPVTVAVDSSGLSIHEEGVAKWKNHIINKV